MRTTATETPRRSARCGSEYRRGWSFGPQNPAAEDSRYSPRRLSSLVRPRRPSGGADAGQHRAQDFLRVVAEPRDEPVDDVVAALIGSGDQHDVIDQPGKKPGARVAGHVDRGDDHHVEALGLVERLFDVGVADAAVAAAVRRNERQEID